IEDSINEINTKLITLHPNSEEFISATREINNKSKLLDVVKEITKRLDVYKQALEMAQDAELAELAQSDITENEAILKDLNKKLLEFTQKPLKDDESRAIMEFRPGVGGVEASLFAEELFRMYVRYCNDESLGLETVSI